MEPVNSSEKGFVCQICGDEGFTNAFLYCVNCMDSVVHRYCLNMKTRTFHEHVIWYCEHCKSTVPKQKEEAACSRHVKATHHKKKRKKERGPVSLISATKEVNHYRHAQPVSDPVWRGTFSILHKDYAPLNGLVAHSSNKACDKVYKEANMFPSFLHLEMHPKNLLWPKSFQDHEPSDENIALYFFPGDPINEKNFERLVQDMIDEGLAMRAIAKNAELLIFTSTLLPRFFWRFQGKYYLWGVFRGKRNESTLVASHDLRISSDGDKYGFSKDSPNEVIREKTTLPTMKSLDVRSPRSPLSNNGNISL